MRVTPPTTKSRPRRIANWLGGLVQASLLLALALSVAWIAREDLGTALDTRDFAALARRIERGGRVPPEAVEAMRPAAAAIARRSACNDRVNRAAVSVALADQQSTNPAVDFEGWAGGLGRLIDLLGHGLSCTPSNGTFWAHLALAERAASPTGGRIGDLMAFAARRAPAEIAGLKVRSEVWRVTPWLDGEAALWRSLDLRRILAGAAPRDAVRMLRDAHPEVEAEARSYFAELPPRRSEQLTRRGLFSAPQPPVPPRVADGYFGGLFPARR